MEEMITHKKPDAFYTDFTRKGSTDVKSTHYCPGCGHGRVHKLIAEALSDMKIADKTVFISPVGCSVFAYYYMKTGNVQAAHGRAPAVATGVTRSHPDSVVISYQGDGDLAAIGTAEIIHAANRGENMVVFFINNAIYGMTGGQMAPTTLIGQKTITTPRGRTLENEGFPIRMAEIISTLEKPVYVERCAVTDPKKIMQTRRAVRKAIENAKNRKGFSFVEILAGCPTGLKVTPKDSLKWIEDNMFPIYPVKNFKDNSATAESYTPPVTKMTDDEVFSMLKLERGKTPTAKVNTNFKDQSVKISGFGGQGVLTAGVMLSTAGMNEGLHVSWIPSYGPEMRGGTANCSVIVSNKRIGSPVSNNPTSLIAMNGPSLVAFESSVVKDGIIIVNTSMVEQKVSRTDVKAIYAPITEIATNIGLKHSANMVALGVYMGATDAFDKERIYEVIRTSLKKKEYVDINIKAFDEGYNFAKKNM